MDLRVSAILAEINLLLYLETLKDLVNNVFCSLQDKLILYDKS
ncbi:hypothetical protein WN944_009713 [Citrus x changshan-huyou]|uniref:Uncharacterized protein n=1 Tax=Citrus x changshan-huyou TaxID=2935761 RepID=A0AAP0MWN7_9ROSI